MQALLEKIKDLDIRIQVEGNDLRLSIPDNVDCESIIEEIREHKNDLINFIQKKKNRVKRDLNGVTASAQTAEIKLTPTQRRIFILQQLAKNAIAYNIPLAIEINGAFDVELLEHSIRKLIQRHEILRTQFKLDANNNPIQIVQDKFEFNVECLEATEADLPATIQEFVRPFNLDQAPLIRTGLIRISETRCVMVLDMHHIVADGASQKVFIQELLELYNLRSLDQNPLQFRDYVNWFFSPNNQNHIRSQRSFWLQQLSGYRNELKLPTDFPREKTLTFEGKSLSFSLGAKRLKKLNQLAKQSDASLFMVLLSLYGIMLSKLTQADDIVVGTPVANRTHWEFQRMIGMIVNTLPIRIQPRATLHFRDYLKLVAQKALSCFDNQEYMYEEIIKDLDLSRSTDPNPLFDCLISLNKMEGSKIQMNGVEFKPVGVNKPTAKFDLSIHFTEVDGQLNCVFEYRTLLFTTKTIKRYFQYFRNIVDQVINDETILLKNISLLNQKQKAGLLKLNDYTDVDYPEQATVVELFEKQAAAHPKNTALIINEETFTYQELNNRANQIASTLRDAGIGPDNIVGIFLDKSFEMIASMLGILKAGGAYLPIDLAYPASRINYLIEHSKASLLLTDKASAHRLESYQSLLLMVDDISTEQQPNLPLVNQPGNLCYIIYTSGTTGNPKGVMVEHRNLVRLLFNDQFQFEFSEADTWTMFHSASFDFSVWEMYGALLYGGTLVIIPPETARNAFAFRNIVEKHQVTVLNQTPTAFYNFIKASGRNGKSKFPYLRYVIFGGEELVPGKLEFWHSNNSHTQLINMYGITETTVHVTFKRLNKRDIAKNISNIGKPIPTNLIYLLDSDKNVVPVGSIGEIYVGGEGVSRGYLNNPELTASRFIPNPFKEGQALYKSGDVARQLSSGEYEYLGRNDRQVQIKGFRIELGEIEYQLEQNELVKHAVVIANKDEKYPWICAYIVTDANLKEEELREFLSNRLPYYMVPNYFIKIDSVPFTSNFKVDYKSLPAPSQVESSNYVAPSTKQQKVMSEIFLKHLGSSKIGINDNFFALGGDSIRALGVISEINEALHTSLEIADLYAYPTVEELCKQLDQKSSEDWVNLKALAEQKLLEFQEHYKANFPWMDNYEEVYPMNGIEKGMVFHSLESAKEDKSIHDVVYHEQNIYLFAGTNFDFERFKVCLGYLVKKHSTLRKIYDLENLAHIILKNVEPELKYIDISHLARNEQEAFIAKAMHEEKLKETKLDFSLFWRMTMFKVSEVHHYLLYDFHHSLFDGWSLSTFLTELRNTYILHGEDENFRPEPLQTSYRDQIIEEMAATLNQESIQYWQKELNGFERLNFNQTGLPHEFRTHYYDLGKDFRKEVEKVAYENNSNLKHLCFLAYLYLMKMFTGRNDITTGLVTNNRPTTKDGEKLLGCFLNTIPFRAKFEENQTWQELVKYIDSKMIELKRHEKIPMGEIVKLAGDNTSSISPIFESSFSYLDFHVFNNFIETSSSVDEETGFSFENFMNNNTLFDIVVTTHKGTFTFVILSSTTVIDDAISSKLFGYFKNILQKLVGQINAKVVQNDLLPASEKDFLLGPELNPVDCNKPITSIAKKFEKQVKRTPNNIALVCGSEQLTYLEVYYQAKRLAQYLRREKQIEPGDFVGIKMDRSVAQIIALLGVLQTRACYVPIDPAYPEQRLKFIEEDSQCKEIIDADWMQSFLEVASEYEQQLEEPEYLMTDNVYMIYTSGSTGLPKGVPINNSNIGNYIEWALEYYKGDLDHFSFPYVTSLSFDISQPIILLTLFSGGKLFIYNDENLGETMKAVMANKALNSFFLTPSFLQFVEANTPTHITNFILGGEALLPGHIKKLKSLSAKARIFNAYGPTESTVGCTSSEIFDIKENETISIGKPISNAKIYILDDQNQLIPHGFVGELCVSGVGVAHGYLNRPELNQEKFLPDPYAKDGERRMYRSGDLARWTENGQLELVGRKDDQVKIRGYRIELEEIISCIDKHEMVAQNVVLTKQDHQGNNILVGYIVPKTDAFDKGQFREDLKRELPHYMVPGVLVELEAMPLNQSGKIDRSSLLQIDITSQEAKVAPRNEMEATLLEIWQEVLKLDTIGIHDNFFELGGHSVSAIVLINKIQRAFQVKVPLQELFNNSSLASLAQFIGSSAKDDRIVIEPAPAQKFYPLSSVQKRQYFIYQLYPDSLLYNIPVVLRVAGQLDITKLEGITNELTTRHTILRTCFQLQDGNPVQRVMENIQQHLTVITCTESDINNQIEAFVRPFNLEEELPIRYGVLKIADDDHILMIDMHHIIFDEASRDIILREMMELYLGASLAQPRLQYKDYAVWQEGDYYRDMVSAQRDFWLKVYMEAPPTLEIPTDYPRPKALNGSAHVASIKLEKALSDQIRTIVRQEGTSIFNFMMAAYNIFLSKLANQNDITVGITTSGRQHADLEEVLGMFANTLALRNQVEAGMTFQAFLAALHNNTLHAFDHRFYPYEDLVDALKVPRVANRNPLFDVYMIYSQKIDDSLFEYPDFTIEPYQVPFEAAKFDLTLTVLDAPDEIELSIAGHEALFKSSSIERFTKYLKQIIKEAAVNPEQKIEDIDLLSREEKQRLFAFNQPNAVIEKTIIGQFSEQVQATPFNQAITFQDKTLTYLELDKQAKRLANYLLQEKGIEPGNFIGIKLQRSDWSVISMLGVLYARVAYVPIDPEYPEDRIRYIETDSQCKELIDEAWIELFLKEEGNYSAVLAPLDYQMSDNVYMIYTSGSTGKPKGVAINNHNLDNYVTWALGYYKGDLEQYSFPLFTSLSFDLTQTSILLPLLSGGSVFVYNDEDIMATMQEILANEAINSLKLTPSHLQIFEDGCTTHITNFILGGEVLLPGHIKILKACAPQGRIFNEYGPTEATIGCTCEEVSAYEEGKFISIGKPIANTNVYILNNHNQLVPPGMVGELCVSGPSVAHGYYNRPELTQQKFSADPYSREKGRRMYKTGDLARWTEDGELELFGRKDDQVKVRGYRVELGEIIATIDKYKAVKHNTVLAKKDDMGTNTLIAYIVPEAEGFDLEQFKKYLENALPFYAVPQVVITLDKLPLTQNGKIDKASLLKIEITSTKVFEAPRNELEATLADIWQEVLGVDTIGIHDNFFELGGNSLKAILMVNKISKALSVVTTLRSVFDYQDIKSLAEYVNGLEKVAFVAIPKAPISDAYPLSSAQQRMYFLYELDKEGISYNMPVIYQIDGKLDISQLEQAFTGLVNRHQSLRTVYELRDGQPVQRLIDGDAFGIEQIEVTEADKEAKVMEFIRPFDLSQEFPIRVTLMTTSEQSYLLMVDIHHIAGDRVSMEVLMQDFWSLYQGNRLEDLDIQYVDYAVWQQGKAYQELVAKHKAYWLDVFSEEVVSLELPTDHARPAALNSEGYRHMVALSEAQSEGLRSLARQEGVTMYTLLLGIYKVLLHKLTNEADIVVGTPTAGRQHADTEGIVGLFINTLAMRNAVNPEGSFKALLAQVHDHTLSAFDHQLYQYEDLVEALEVPRNINRNPLFDVFYAYNQQVEGMDISESELDISPYHIDHIISKFDLSLDIYENEAINIAIRGRKDLFEPATLERFMDYLNRIIGQVLSNPEQEVKAIDILSKTEKDQLLDAFNDTTVHYDLDKTVLDRFVEQAARTPGTTALIFNEKAITYRELDALSTQWASCLIQQGVKPGSIVGLLMTRSTEMITAILAIMKAGAAYLPLNTEQPIARTIHMLEDSESKLVLTNATEILEALQTSITCVSTESLYAAKAIKGEKTLAFPTAQDLAYVIYTSGTTGKPKGVMIEHQSLSNLILHLGDYYGIHTNESILQFSPYYFDASVEQIWLALTTGSRLNLIEKNRLFDAAFLNEFLRKNKVTYLHATPSFLEKMNLENLPNLRRIIAAGEVCPPSLAQKLAAKYPFYNKYGPTECTVTSTIGAVKPGVNLAGNVPIGKPISNAQAFILNSTQQLVPQGVIGELFIGGKGLSKGYLSRPDITAERYIENPYGKGQLYKTGDLAKWLPDGNIAFIGRADQQVKIDGVRIELGEIESQLKAFEGIKDGVVVLRELQGIKSLVAYYVSESSVTVSQIRGYLLDRLPLNMIPGHYVQMEALPLTPSGKLDRRALPDPAKTERVYQAPSTPTEAQLVQIWSEILQTAPEQISVNDGFFELGGNSLKAILMVNKISKALSVTTTLRSVFEFQDIESLAKHVDSLEKVAFVEIPKAPIGDHYPLSSAQQRMYFLYELDKGGTAYNMPVVYRINGKLDRDQLEQAFKGLVSRHQSLRTIYEVQDGQPIQRLVEEDAFSLDFREVRESEVESRMMEFIRPFNLGQELPIRVALMATAEQSHILMIDMHHIAGDGVSMSVLMRDFWSLYQGESLKDLEIQYVDYAVWQQGDAYQELVAKHKAYWLDVYSEEVEALELPTDHVRPSALGNEGYRHTLALGKVHSERLRSLAQQESVTMYNLFLAIYKVLLHKITNEEDLVVGTPTAGRHHVDTEGMVGMFVNTLALRNSVKPEWRFSDLLAQIQDHTLSAFDHQLYQYEDLVEALEVPRNINRNPLFDVFYAYNQQVEGLDISTSGLDISPFGTGPVLSKFDLSLDISEDEAINITITGRKELFEPSTLERFMAYLNRIIGQVLSNPDQAVKKIDILSKAEKDQLIKAYNNTSVAYDLEKTVLDLFTEQVAKTPNATALIFNEKAIAYKELDTRSTQWANCLIQKGVKPGSVVGLLMTRSTEMITAMLAVIKTGAAYLPLNTEQPLARTLHMIEESESKVILSNIDDIPEALKSAFSCLTATVLDGDPTTKGETTLNSPTAQDLAYIIYTSGTTGKPKGVMIAHSAMADYVQTFSNYFKLTEKDKVIHQSSISFDTSIEEIFPVLISGGSLFILPQGKDLDGLFKACEDNQISLLSGVPYVLDYLNNNHQKYDLSLRTIISGGDTLKNDNINNIYQKFDIYNTYGPTESTVCASFYKIAQLNGSIPIGRPISNREIYLLNPAGQVVPQGVTGELFIGGKGLSRGYLKRPDLTSERFIENPFGTGRLYKTGDLARWLPDGNIAFIGRADQQVKLNGVRIELGEIESHLNSMEGITDAVVMLCEIRGIPSLVAYYVSDGNTAVSELRRYLLDRLPLNMIPGHYVQLETLPVNSSGKLDRKSLPAPEETESVYKAPETTTEEQLVNIWSEILPLEAKEISVDANFFIVGGHSLVLIKMMHLIRETFGTEIAVDYIYRYPTIEEIAKRIDDRKTVAGITEPRPILLKEQEQAEGNVFFMHDGSGQINGYLNLAQAMKKYNCYGLAFENMEIAIEHLDIDEIVSIYLERIKKIQKEGPYILVGWSTGGVLSYEMARRLENQGEQVEKVILIDTHFNLDENSQTNKISLESEIDLIHSWTGDGIKLNTAEINSIAALWKAFFEHPSFGLLTMDQLKTSIPQPIQQLIGFSDQMTTREALMACNRVRYISSVIDGHQLSSSIDTKVTYIKASESGVSTEEIAKYITNFRATEVQGTHFSIMENDSVKVIVEKIEA